MITVTIVFKAQSMNYGDSNNFLVLKKFNRGDGTQETTMSRQAIRYSIVTQGEKMFGWELQKVDKSKGTVQFKEESSIQILLKWIFGYMMTKKMRHRKIKSKGADTRSVQRDKFCNLLEPYKMMLNFKQ